MPVAWRSWRRPTWPNARLRRRLRRAGTTTCSSAGSASSSPQAGEQGRDRRRRSPCAPRRHRPYRRRGWPHGRSRRPSSTRPTRAGGRVALSLAARCAAGAPRPRGRRPGQAVEGGVRRREPGVGHLAWCHPARGSRRARPASEVVWVPAPGATRPCSSGSGGRASHSDLSPSPGNGPVVSSSPTRSTSLRRRGCGAVYPLATRGGPAAITDEASFDVQLLGRRRDRGRARGTIRPRRRTSPAGCAWMSRLPSAPGGPRQASTRPRTAPPRPWPSACPAGADRGRPSCSALRPRLLRASRRAVATRCCSSTWGARCSASASAGRRDWR